MEPYSHTPLSLPRSIRLLVLEPAATLDAPLKCSLREEDLDTASLYHALSYVWGPPDAPTAELLQIRMPSGYGRLTLRRNCATALRHLRLAKETRTIWVDAICIDQVSIPEKNQQIPLMQKIFKSASRVIIWMDVSDIGSKQVRRIFRYFNQQRSLFTRNFIRADSDDECERSYFTTRLWERYSKLSGTLLAGRFIYP
jgi:hypothetical protein